MSRTRTLPISGYHGRPIPNVLYEPAERIGHLVVFFPDLRYPSSAPLFHYLRRLYLDMGADVLSVDYDYPRIPRYLRRPDVEKQRWFLADVLASYEMGVIERPSKRLTLVGKSVGTFALAHLTLSGKLTERAELIWVTPPLDSESLPDALRGCRYRSLVLLGAKVPEATRSRAAELIDTLPRNPHVKLRVFEHANEELERADGTVSASIELLQSAVGSVESFSRKE